MAKPQLEDGHTQIANEILEHLVRIYLPPNQWQVLLYIIRKTYGFHKKVDWIANCQIVEATGLVKSTVSRALRSLEMQNLITRNKKQIGLQKDWEHWEVSSAANNKKLAIRQPKLADRKLQLAIQSTKVSSPRVAQKKKENIQKKLYKRNSKQKFGESLNVFLTIEEYEKLKTKFGQQEADNRIEGLSLAIASKGYKYLSHYHTILNWSRREKGGNSGEYRKPDKQAGASQNTVERLRQSIAPRFR